MYMKRRMFLEFAYRKKKFMIFDSDVVFHMDPHQLMDADTPPSMYGQNVNMVVFGSVNVLIGAIPGWVQTGENGKFAMNGSPAAYLSPDLLLPWFKALFEYGIGLWSQCLWGWGQIGDNYVFHQMGLRWEIIREKNDNNIILEGSRAYRTTWESPAWDGGDLTKGELLSAQKGLWKYIHNLLYQELLRAKRPTIVAADNETPYLPARHYNAPGGPIVKATSMRRDGNWLLADDWEEKIDKEGASILDLLVFDRKSRRLFGGVKSSSLLSPHCRRWKSGQGNRLCMKKQSRSQKQLIIKPND